MVSPHLYCMGTVIKSHRKNMGKQIRLPHRNLRSKGVGKHHLCQGHPQKPLGSKDLMEKYPFTLPKINIAPRNDGWEDDFPLTKGDFQVPC